ncbi:MAG: TonB-dependent receptor [Wenzhouxiangellaceae bacterium]|nr:TonB-dependent receptor [Wenzhouxiangellaceae bacterium]
MGRINLRRTALATGIAMALHTAAVMPALAQDNEQDRQSSDTNERNQEPQRQSAETTGMAGPREVEDEAAVDRMVVTGYRGSVMRAMGRKRNSIGVVDSITAEDIGDFPDQNLAESLQRIPGVAIDRNNNEGSQITVRGLGPEFNLVTLNGRSMPTAGSRSFDFADLATMGISAVDVYKTPQSELPSGGIGATVNILTPRPLDRPGFRAVISGKAVHETSSTDADVGNLDEVTPEIEGLYSQTFFDDKFGIFLSGAYQERDNREENAEVANWSPATAATAGAINNPFAAGNVTNNNQRTDGVFWHPQNIGYGWSDLQRERINGQLVLQFAPTDRITATLDYTYSRVEREADRNSVGVWFECPNIDATINENGTVTEVSQACGDFSTNVARDHTIKENNQIGFNVEFQATDSLAFTADYHASSSELRGGDINGRPGSSANLIIGNTACDWCGFVDGAGPFTAAIDRQTVRYPGAGVPLFDVSFRSTGPDGGPQEGLLRQDIGSLFGQAFNVNNDNDIKQLQLGGTWSNLSGGALDSISFGYDRTEQEFDQINAFSGLLPAGFWLTSAQYWDDEAFTEGSFGGLLDDFGNGGDFAFEQFFTAPLGFLINGFETVGADNFPCCYWPDTNFWTEDFQDPSGERGLFWPGPLGNSGQSSVNEDLDAAYVRADFEDTFNGMPYNASVGLRWETAETVSFGQERPPEAIVWVGGDEFTYDFVGEPQLRRGTGSSDFWLPSFAFALEVVPDVIARAAYSRSISRPPIGALGPNRSFDGAPNIGSKSVSSGNPDLQPFVSDNFDLSLEWYYAPGSYASVGFFNKLVDNFLISTTVERTFEGLRDPFLGPLAEQAREELAAEGINPDNAAVFRRMNAIRGAEPNAPIRQSPDDPLALFRVTTTTNAEEGDLYGFEFAVQHLFGRSGWGVQANATLVEGDVDADPNVVDQSFALPGLSDTANLVLFYETERFSGRVAYNWRDEFLSGFDQFGAPVFTESFAPIDINLTYNFNENLSVFVEGLNINKETQRIFSRYSEQMLRANQYGARYNFGVRYRF